MKRIIFYGVDYVKGFRVEAFTPVDELLNYYVFKGPFYYCVGCFVGFTVTPIASVLFMKD